jgi:uncharacterized protein YdbL (DUF1318 family)
MRKALYLTAGLVAALLGAGTALAMQDAGQLRASGQAAEKADGYLAPVGSASAAVRAQIDAINIQRRALYTQTAQQRGATIEEAAAAAACQIFASRIGSGQRYVLEDGVVRTRNGNEPVPLPRQCS